MIKALLFDFSRVLLFYKDKEYLSSLNKKHRELGKNTDYNVLDYFELNLELLAYLKALTSKYSLYIFTSETLQDDPVLQPFLKNIFRKVYSGVKLGLNKKDSDAYKYIAGDIGFLPEEIAFVDDTEANIEAAKAAGLRTVHYKNNQQLMRDLVEILK